jgi:hypothetical protein
MRTQKKEKPPTKTKKTKKNKKNEKKTNQTPSFFILGDDGTGRMKKGCCVFVFCWFFLFFFFSRVLFIHVYFGFII